jgi:hypothetical protein
MVPLTGMLVGTEGAMEFHFARAVLSLATMVAGVQMGGKAESAELTLGYVYGVHSWFGSGAV